MADDLEEGAEVYDQEWDEEYEEAELPEEEVVAEMKPELKRLYQQHPECLLDYMEQVIPKIQLHVLPPGGISTDPEHPTVDPNHRTYPFLTTFERTKIIGLRANQISKGSVPFISVPSHITDVRDIARLELEQKRLPYLVKRPLPDGSFEYWRLSDLLIL
jgi:DNA-directed RNA polymerase I, II, and III subunit RPABC2